MAIGLPTATRTTRIDAIKASIDAGGAAGKLRFYDGVRPATGGTATTLLAELTLPYPCGSVTSGALTFGTIVSDSSANATGTATWARIITSASAFALDLSVGLTGSGADIIMNATSIIIGGPVGVASAVLTEGNA